MGLVFIGFVAMFWWVIVAALGVLLLAGVIWYVSRCLDARDAALLAIAARADTGRSKTLARALHHRRRWRRPYSGVVGAAAIGGCVGTPYRIVQTGTWPGVY